MVAQARQHDHGAWPPGVGGDFVLQDSGAELPDGRQVFQRTTDRTGLAANALAQVDHHAIALAGHAGTARRLAVQAGGFGMDGDDGGGGAQAKQPFEKTAFAA
ncbi:hypothetical protein D3C78_1576590 [compost metagenome]